MLVIVRHAQVIKDPDRPVEEWVLDPARLGDLTRLRTEHDWDRLSAWYSSPEPKAVATAAALTGLPVARVDAFREVRRGGWSDDYDSVVVRLFAAPDTPPAPGWEAASAALARFDQGLRDVVRAGTDTAVVTHGLVISLWRAALSGRPVDLTEWRALRFPDVFTVSDPEVERWLANGRSTLRSGVSG